MTEEIKNLIKKEWLTKSMGNVNFSEDEKIDDGLLEDETVLLIKSTNMFGDPVYVYLKMTMQSFRKLRDVMIAKQNFVPSDYGEVLAAGRGEPGQELIDEMRVQYKMVDIPRPKESLPANTGFAQPKFFDDND